MPHIYSGPYRGLADDPGQHNLADRIEAFLAVLHGGMKIESLEDEAMARLYAAAILEKYYNALDKLRNGAPIEGWFVAENQEPGWGIGVRLEFDFNRVFLIYALRREIAETPLYITVGELSLDTYQCTEKFRVTGTADTSFLITDCGIREPNEDEPLALAVHSPTNCRTEVVNKLSVLIGELERALQKP